MDEKNYVITIGRQFGSGGREIGKLVAERLGIAYYDKELLCEAAKKAGVSPEFFEKSDENFRNFSAGSSLLRWVTIHIRYMPALLPSVMTHYIARKATSYIPWLKNIPA